MRTSVRRTPASSQTTTGTTRTTSSSQCTKSTPMTTLTSTIAWCTSCVESAHSAHCSTLDDDTAHLMAQVLSPFIVIHGHTHGAFSLTRSLPSSLSFLPFSVFFLYPEMFRELDNPIVTASLRYSAAEESEDTLNSFTSPTLAGACCVLREHAWRLAVWRRALSLRAQVHSTTRPSPPALRIPPHQSRLQHVMRVPRHPNVAASLSTLHVTTSLTYLLDRTPQPSRHTADHMSHHVHLLETSSQHNISTGISSSRTRIPSLLLPPPQPGTRLPQSPHAKALPACDLHGVLFDGPAGVPLALPP